MTLRSTFTGARVAMLATLMLLTSSCSGLFNPFAGVRRLVAIAHFIVALVVVADIVTSKRSLAWKTVWVAVVVIFPILGLIAYLVVGRPD